MFDPCGTRTLDGNDILQRVAQELGVDVEMLKNALRKLL